MGLHTRSSSFMRYRLPWIVAALLLTGIVLTTFALWRSTAPAPQSIGEDGQIPRYPAETGRLAQPRAPQNDGAADSRGDPTALAMRKLAQHDVARNARRKRVQSSVDATNAALAARFMEEKTDPAWSTSKEHRLAELSTSSQINDINATIKNLSINCKSTVCMLNGDFADTSAGDDWFTLYMNNVGAEVPYATYKYVPGKDGRVTIQVYAIARKR